MSTGKEVIFQVKEGMKINYEYQDGIGSEHIDIYVTDSDISGLCCDEYVVIDTSNRWEV